MHTQKKLVEQNKSEVVVLIDLWSCRLCILFKDTGQLSLVPFDQWEHMTSRTHKKVKHPHYKMSVLVPEEDTILCHNKGDLSKELKKLVFDVEPKPCYGMGWSYTKTHCKPPIGENKTGHECPDCPMKLLVKK